jgi:3-deoxy-7-phosphoheptulonate synthase
VHELLCLFISAVPTLSLKPCRENPSPKDVICDTEKSRVGAYGVSEFLRSSVLNSLWNEQFSRLGSIAVTEGMPRSVIQIDDLEIGGSGFVVMAGPCSVESESQILETAEAVRLAGARILRGGAFKPRSSPYSFQGLGVKGLKLLAKARAITGLKIVTEVMAETEVSLVSEYADILQIGTRNMENFSLLQAVGKSGRPVLLKRGMSARIEELLCSAQLVVDSGNPDVILCERGIRTFETATRNTFDISAIPLLNAVSRLPVIADPSHGCGIRELVPALARAAVVAGADGLIVEVHPHPDRALSDGEQSLTPSMFAEMMEELQPYLALRARTSTTLCAGVR